MATFTKPFVFASHFLALASFSPSPPAAQQIISSMKVIFGEDGTSRGVQNSDGFAKTTNFLWSELQTMGFQVLGDNDFPCNSHNAFRASPPLKKYVNTHPI
ncbi:unnamed protein product [Malus baccata var. baccata]